VGNPFLVVIHSETLVGARVHYAGRRSSACNGREAGCEHCAAGLRAGAYFYAAVWHIRERRGRLMECTQRALDHCPELVALNGRLRGLRVQLSRAGDDRGPVAVRLVEGAGAVPPDYPEIDVREQLRRIWSAPDRQESWELVQARMAVERRERGG
jgi:hypothetical protein